MIENNLPPIGINAYSPVPKPDAKKITALVKKSGKITGYALSDGKIVSKTEGIALAKAGDIKDVGVATRNGNEYLRTLPDGSEGNNLGNLPSLSEDKTKN